MACSQSLIMGWRTRRVASLAGRVAVVVALFGAAHWSPVPAAAYPPQSSMVGTLVDAVGDVGRHCAIAVGVAGNPLVVYQDATNNFTKVAERVDGLWHTQFIGPASAFQFWCAIAVGPDGSPHVVYKATGNRIVHTVRIGQWWYPDTLSSGGDPWYGSMAVGEDNTVHIAYWVYGVGGRYARGDTAGWHIEDAPIGEFNSITLRDGIPHVAYRGFGVDIAVRDAAPWRVETVPGTSPPYATSLACDQQGWRRVAYSDPFGDMRYAFEDGTAWHVEPLATLPSGCPLYSVSRRLTPWRAAL